VLRGLGLLGKRRIFIYSHGKGIGIPLLFE
jgi:hypothetical protein